MNTEEEKPSDRAARQLMTARRGASPPETPRTGEPLYCHCGNPRCGRWQWFAANSKNEENTAPKIERHV